MSYLRIIPRDFFNESKLLKCLGKLQLSLMENKNVFVDFDGDYFQIEQNVYDGSICVTNYHVLIGGKFLHLYTPLNARDDWPLMCVYEKEHYCVFNERGEFISSVVTDFILGKKKIHERN